MLYWNCKLRIGNEREWAIWNNIEIYVRRMWTLSYEWNLEIETYLILISFLQKHHPNAAS